MIHPSTPTFSHTASKLVGPTGQVIGVDMTDEQLAVARAHVDWHTERYGYKAPNVRFVKGVIEDLSTVGIADASVDVVVSNCVLNLSPSKPRVLREVFRVLKPGGELYFSDVFCDRRLPAALREDQEVLGECLGGALYIEDFRRLLADELGCKDYRVMEEAPIEVTDETIAAKVSGSIRLGGRKRGSKEGEDWHRII
jgi:arsenite methyltransferase